MLTWLRFGLCFYICHSSGARRFSFFYCFCFCVLLTLSFPKYSSSGRVYALQLFHYPVITLLFSWCGGKVGEGGTFSSLYLSLLVDLCLRAVTFKLLLQWYSFILWLLTPLPGCSTSNLFFFFLKLWPLLIAFPPVRWDRKSIRGWSERNSLPSAGIRLWKNLFPGRWTFVRNKALAVYLKWWLFLSPF